MLRNLRKGSLADKLERIEKELEKAENGKKVEKVVVKKIKNK